MSIYVLYTVVSILAVGSVVSILDYFRTKDLTKRSK